MSNAIELNHLWKKFNRGEFNDCLRDTIPAWFNRLIGRGPKQDELTQKEFWALKDLDFKIEEGETVGFIGHNGAGKSTLLKILSNILEPTRGAMRVKGKLRSLIEIGSGFHGDLTGRENIYLNGAILGMTHREIEKNFDSIVDFSGVEEFLDMPVKRYSSGMFARLGFAVAAHLEPDVLIVDEVLSVGDTAFQKKCLGKMNDVAQSGRTVLFVSHNMGAVHELCQRCILLQKGKVIDDGTSDSVISQYYSLLRNEQIELENKCRQAQQKAQIKSIHYGNVEGELAEQGFCEINGELYIRAYLEIREPVDLTELHVVFMDSQENHLIGFHVMFTPDKIGMVRTNGFVDFRIPHFPLNRGVYSVGAAIFEKGDKDRYGERIDHYAQRNVLTVVQGDWPLNKLYYEKCFTPYSCTFHFEEKP